MKVLGIDIGTSFITGCIVNCETGKLDSEIYKVDVSPDLSPPSALSKMHSLIKHFKWQDLPIGVALPEVIRRGAVLSSNELSNLWLDVHAEQLFEEITESPVHIINHTDAAATAEMYYGAAETQLGTVVYLDIRNKLKSSIFVDKKLVPNVELGYLLTGSKATKSLLKVKTEDGQRVEKKKPFKRTEFVLQHLEEIFHPELFVIGNTMSGKLGKYVKVLDVRTAYTEAKIKNYSENIGAATAAWLRFR